ncbi:MAG TPA: BatA and WFA domain-containing protein [Pirellulales bacterium]|jgi:hypothetical protein|nr:BatA and WFA domain-containing protein [Pirellulales bacterium]
MFFALPWMFLGLLGLPALAAIYWLRSRARPRTVSSLFLWADQRRPRQGGRVIQRLQTPLSFFLEMLAIACVVFAAAAPSVTHSRFARPIVVVLDDSYSMTAGGDASPRQRAGQALVEDFRHTDYVARFVLAGAQPRLIGSSVRSADQVRVLLEQWTCAAPTAGVDAAIALASEIGGPSARVLVVTDHAPRADLPAGKVQWRSFGQVLPNVAITAATRDTSLGGTTGQEDRVLLEVTNFAAQRKHAEMFLEGGGAAGSRKPLDLQPGATSRMIFNVPAGSEPLRATLGDDALAIDNQAVLVSPQRRPLRVQVAISHEAADLRPLVVRAFEACGQALLVDNRPDIVVSDSSPIESADAWQWQILRGPEPVSYEGPFVLDRSHPLAEGLSLEAVIWSAAREAVPDGTPVLTAGNRVLLADAEDAAGHHTLQMALEPRLSNLAQNPDWPILVANLVRWRQSAMPGPAASNVRLGQTLRITLPDDAAAAGKATVTPPDAAPQTLPIHGRQLEVRPERIGLYTARAGSMEFAFASSALDPDESNLSQCASGQWGDWNESDVYQDQRVNLGWAFILLALGCLTVQMVVVSRAGAAGS